MKFSHKGVSFTVTASSGSLFNFNYTVVKEDKAAGWPGEGGKFPPASFLEAMHNGDIEYGEFDSQNEDGSREYFICQEVSFL
jgi:hypothetical protein